MIVLFYWCEKEKLKRRVLGHMESGIVGGSLMIKNKIEK